MPFVHGIILQCIFIKANVTNILKRSNTYIIKSPKWGSNDYAIVNVYVRRCLQGQQVYSSVFSYRYAVLIRAMTRLHPNHPHQL